ncbi:MAG: 30S ribosome-binding factor RbfA [Nitrospinota bacterium]
MKRFSRSDRLAAEFAKEISSIISKDLKDPQLELTGILSVVRLELTKDIKNAKVFISIFDKLADKDLVIERLNKAKGYIRTQLGKRMRIRKSPELLFLLDSSISHMAELDSILKDIKSTNGD